NIAEKYNIPLAALLIWNRLNLTHPIHPGDRLVIHPRSIGER
ncbi:MAG: LysM peptidoglycan-binding domain-containing protein, partial [Deltaproteobacteria bacterium]|nr:LysM peptidoglycan-binding domain-containing protein [Deltaproteobacteria bacterium]